MELIEVIANASVRLCLHVQVSYKVVSKRLLEYLTRE